MSAGAPGANDPHFRAMVERCGFGVWNVGAGGATLYVNPAMCAMLEVDSQHDLEGRAQASFFSPEDLARITAAERAGMGTVHVGIRGARGARRHTICVVSPVGEGASVPQGSALRTFADVTDLQREEERSQRAEKLEAIGRLAGGIAHDFNNLLLVVYTCCGLLDRLIPEGQPARTYVRQIEAAVKRGADLTRQVLTFSRQDVAAPTSVDVNEVVKSLIAMLNRVIPDDIEVRANVDRSLWPVFVNRGRLEQVLMNLALNARDAMPNGGKLVISTANLEVAGEQARNLDVAPGEYVLIAVADTGHGMDEETRAKAFEPFFTTKASKGTGLGLATSFGIVRQAGGAITADTTPGHGATFSVWLPVARAHGREEESLEPPRSSRTAVETVLLVDDEEAIRKPLAEFLRLHGFKVLEAHNGVSAMEHAEKYEGPIEVLVTDVVMPRMGGKTLADALRARRPEMRVLFLSGHSESTIARRGQAESGAAVLQKPFPPLALVSRIHELVTGAALKAGP